MTDQLYRYEATRYSLGLDQFDNPIPGYTLQVSLRAYDVIRRTPCGAWIDVGFLDVKPKFVLLTARKQFACETPELAAESFLARKRAHLRHLKAKVEEAELAILKVQHAETERLRREHMEITNVAL